MTVSQVTVAPEHPNLNKDRVELFLAALESGDYTQCTGSLRAVNQFDPNRPWRHCALGVATDVALNNGLQEELSGWSEASLFVGGALDEEVKDWYGFDTDDPVLTDDQWTVSGFNDNDVPFWDIAQVGRAKWLKDQG